MQPHRYRVSITCSQATSPYIFHLLAPLPLYSLHFRFAHSDIFLVTFDYIEEISRNRVDQVCQTKGRGIINALLIFLIKRQNFCGQTEQGMSERGREREKETEREERTRCRTKVAAVSRDLYRNTSGLSHKKYSLSLFPLSQSPDASRMGETKMRKNALQF